MNLTAKVFEALRAASEPLTLKQIRQLAGQADRPCQTTWDAVKTLRKTGRVARTWCGRYAACRERNETDFQIHLEKRERILWGVLTELCETYYDRGFINPELAKRFPGYMTRAQAGRITEKWVREGKVAHLGRGKGYRIAEG